YFLIRYVVNIAGNPSTLDFIVMANQVEYAGIVGILRFLYVVDYGQTQVIVLGLLNHFKESAKPFAAITALELIEEDFEVWRVETVKMLPHEIAESPFLARGHRAVTDSWDQAIGIASCLGPVARNIDAPRADSDHAIDVSRFPIRFVGAEA